MKTTFGALVIGANFFDPESGEDFVKTSDTQATFASGGDAFEGEVTEFAPNNEVEA